MSKKRSDEQRTIALCKRSLKLLSKASKQNARVEITLWELHETDDVARSLLDLCQRLHSAVDDRLFKVLLAKIAAEEQNARK